jgi:hypothetical protein
VKEENMNMLKVFCIILVLAVAGCGGKGDKKEAAEPTGETTEPTTPMEVEEPAEPEPPPEPEVTAMLDDREAMWGGKVGVLTDLNWMSAVQKDEEGKAWVFVLYNGDAGPQWIHTVSEGDVTVGQEGVLVTMDGAKKIVAYQAVPEEVMKVMKKTYEKTPVPKKEPENEGDLKVVLVTANLHVQTTATGNIIPNPAKPAPKMPKAGKTAKSLGALAESLAKIFMASQPEEEPEEEEGGEEEAE